VSTAAQKSSESISLLIIDPQNDFHPAYEIPEEKNEKTGEVIHAARRVKDGSLAVPGANEDAQRIAQLIMDHIDDIHSIFVTLDSHLRGHIAHARCWVDQQGRHPDPFTYITHDDIWEEDSRAGDGRGRGKWAPSFRVDMPRQNESSTVDLWTPLGYGDPVWKNTLDWCKKYTLNLEKQGNEKLTIWPQHCIIGSRGHAVVHPIDQALQAWTKAKGVPVTYVAKGMNCRVESYSALRADVEDPLDPKTTGLNEDLVSTLKLADRASLCNLQTSSIYSVRFRCLISSHLISSHLISSHLCFMLMFFSIAFGVRPGLVPLRQVYRKRHHRSVE
jgi:nicotinamidase/pyrazinamidase